MQRLPSRGKNGRPHPLQTAKSFTVPDTSDSPVASRNRSSTLPSSTLQIDPPGFASENRDELKADIFEVQSEDGTDAETEADASGSFPESFEELPIEIKSLMERSDGTNGSSVQHSLTVLGFSNLCQEETTPHHCPLIGSPNSTKTFTCMQSLTSPHTQTPSYLASIATVRRPPLARRLVPCHDQAAGRFRRQERKASPRNRC